jgi:CHAT domain-containing protein
MTLIKIILVIMLLQIGVANAKENEAKYLCDQEINKKQPQRELVKKYCTQAGTYFQSKKNDTLASWYYLLGGNNNKNIAEIQNGIMHTPTYANIGHSYILRGELGKANKLYGEFLKKVSVFKADKAMQDDYKKAGNEKKYQEAIKYLTQIIVLQKQYQDKNNIYLWGNLLELGILYKQNNQYKKSLEILYEVESEYKTNLEKTKRFNYLFWWIAENHQQLGNHDKAISYYKLSLTELQKISDKESSFTARIFSSLGKSYQSQGSYSNALEYAENALRIRREVLGNDHVDTVLSLLELGILYNQNKQYKKSLQILLQAESFDKTITSNSRQFEYLFEWIADNYKKLEIQDKAISYYEKSLTGHKKKSAKESSSTARIYSQLAVLYNYLGEYSKALAYQQKALAIIEDFLGETHFSIAASYHNLGMIYKAMGDYPNALIAYQKALAIRIKVPGNEHEDIAEIFASMGVLYGTMGDYIKALEYLKRALAINEKILGKEHSTTADSYHNMAVFYRTIDDYPKALEYFQKSLAIMEKTSGKETLTTAIGYNQLGVLHSIMENYPIALEYAQKSVAIHEKVLGKEHPTLAISYNNLGSLYEKMEEYSKALEYHNKALVIREKVFGKEHVDSASSYTNLASVYASMGDYPKALKDSLKAMAIFEQFLGKDHPATSLSYANTSVYYKNINDYPKSFYYAKRSFDIFLKNKDQVFTVLDTRQKDKYLKANDYNVYWILRMSSEYLSQLKEEKKSFKANELRSSIFNAWLNYKGSIFDSENTISILYASTNDARLKEKIDKLVSSKRMLAKLYQSLPKPEEKGTWQKRIKTTEANIAELTNEISIKVSSFKEQQGLKSISYKDISSYLKEDELYIDYARAGSNYYLFCIDNKEQIKFIQIDEKSTIRIDRLAREFRVEITTILNDDDITDEKLKTLSSSSKEILSGLFELVLNKPLENKFNNKSKLIISPDGALRLLPFEALYDKTNKKYFIEEKEIRYIPSGKELLRLYKYSKDKVANSWSVIFANPDFNTRITAVSRPQLAITPNTNRSSIIKSLFRMRFNPLPGTQAEAKAIKATLDKGMLLEYQQEKATESNLMKVKQPRILHIATHGFFINDKTIPNPMLKSGLALAGANNSAIRGESDGIVTALKLSGLDLKGTDLVVLSACETGVVDIDATDSVSGLSKAFIQAGARDIVMSLWSVNDRATKDLMGSFYQEMKSSLNYAQALKKAKLKMIKEARHPFYWAAFVVSGL